MDLPELQRRVDKHVKLDLSPFYATYRAQGGDDIDGFLAFLGASRAVDPAVLKDLYGLTDVETPSVLDPAYRGTLLARWATSAPTLLGSPATMAATAAAKDAGLPVSDVRFQSISRIGEGAMGAVDIARDVYLRRKIALKTVRPEMAGQPTVFSRFLSEMQITAQLEHPNIVPVYALDVSADGSLGYAMKLVQGKDLAEIIDEARAKVEKGEPLGAEHSLDKRLEYFIKVCDALEYAHSKSVVHRDLKPANIMIGRHNEVYLMDWGIARPIGASGAGREMGFEPPAGPESSGPAGVNANDLRRTRVGDAIGTPPYMSPEQAMGKNDELDGKSDQYSMGLILQECVTLRTAVDGPSLDAVLLKAMQGIRDPVLVGNQPGALPREIDAIVRRATSRDPKDRYPSVGALADEVRRYLRGESVLALSEGPLRRTARFLGRHRMATLSLVLVLVVVGAAGTIGALVAGQRRIDAEHARELRVSQMVAESAIQTQNVDRDLTRYEAALAEFVGAAQIVLSSLPASDAPAFLDDSFGAKETAPPDFGPSKRYGRDVSVLAPATSLAAGVARGPNERLLRSLTLLGPGFRALLLASSDTDWHDMTLPAQRALLADVGVPAYRVTLGLREGVTLSFPGMAGRTPADPREASYLEVVKGKRGVVWGTPTVVDGESMLPATAAIHDDDGKVRGVALLEVSLSRLLARPTSAELDFVQSRSLVGRDGKVVAEDNKPGSQLPLPAEVAAAIAAGKSGSLVTVVNGRRYQYAFHPLSSVDWYYVAASELGHLVDSKEKIVNSDPRKAIAAPSPAPSSKPIAAPPQTAVAPAVPRAEVDAGQEAPADAGANGAADAGSPNPSLPPSRSGTWSTKPSAAPSDEPPAPPNPFEKWKFYERKKKKKP
jgi:serine/threonine-protein kinase